LTARYVADKNPQKINLGVGAYRTDEGKPWVLPTVQKVRSSGCKPTFMRGFLIPFEPPGKQASRILADQTDIDHEYLPITGLAKFTAAAQKLVFGEKSQPVEEGRVIRSVQMERVERYLKLTLPVYDQCSNFVWNWSQPFGCFVLLEVLRIPYPEEGNLHQ
jgi:hypothetical protein